MLIFGTYVHFGIKHITGLPCSYISAVTMAKRELHNKSLKQKYLKFIFGTYVLCHLTDILGCYGSTVTRDKIKSIITDHT